MCLEIFWATFRHQVHRNARGIGGDKCTRLSVFLYFFKKLLLDVQALHYHFNNPVVVLDFGKVVVKVARRDSGSKRLLIDRWWVCLERVLKSCGDDSVANDWRLFGQPFLLLLLIEFKRNDVQKQHLYANVGEVTGNSWPHYSWAQNGHFFNGSIHGLCIKMRCCRFIVSARKWLLPWFGFDRLLFGFWWLHQKNWRVLFR